MSWTDIRVAELRRLAAERLTASEIAAALGGVSKNSVISKCHREGVMLLSGRNPPRSNGPRKRRPSFSYGKRATSAAPPAFKPGTLPPESAAPPTAKMLPLLELTARTCKWPIGHPGTAGFGFCGVDKPAGSPLPYCTAHAVLAYRPAETRRSAQRAAAFIERRAA